MIYSMTAFARRTIHQDWGSAIWEIRSVNHRYLEVFVKLPETLRGLEPQLREHIRKVIQRGKVECYLKYQSQEENVGHLSIDTELVKQLATAKIFSFVNGTLGHGNIKLARGSANRRIANGSCRRQNFTTF